MLLKRAREQIIDLKIKNRYLNKSRKAWSEYANDLKDTLKLVSTFIMRRHPEVASSQGSTVPRSPTRLPTDQEHGGIDAEGVAASDVGADVEAFSPMSAEDVSSGVAANDDPPGGFDTDDSRI